MLLDPAGFGGAEHFQTEVANLAEYIRSCPRIEGCERIVLPGDPERWVFADRSKNGIFLDDENWAALCRLAKDLGVAVPAT
jgi:LDH2 family malate/lactate/ureidoglycolate dehydrogenase